MGHKGRLCVTCVAVVLASASALWSASAYAQSSGGLTSISPEFWLGLFFTVLFSLLGGYAKGIDRRTTALEFDFRQQGQQLSLLREKMFSEHPTRVETAEHRERVEEELRYIRERLDSLMQQQRRGG